MEILHFAVCSLIAVCSVFLLFVKYRFSYWKLRGVVHDEPTLFVGNFGGIGQKNHIRKPFRDCYRKYKGIAPFVGLYLFFEPTAVILDIELVKCVLIKDFNKFSHRGNYYNEKDDPMSAHLLHLDGEKWKQLRTKLSPTFSSGKMKLMFPNVVHVAKHFTAILGDMMRSGNSGSTVVEIKDLLMRFTTDVIGLCALGLNCNSLQDPNSEYSIMGKKIFRDRRYSRNIYVLLQAFPDMGRRLRMKLYPDHISKYFMRIVKETVEYREANNIQRNDVLSILIDLKNQNSNDPSKKNLTIEEIAAQAFLFFLAGMETTSATMGFVMYELAVNQDVQDKAREEIHRIVKNHNGQLTYESLNEMKYLHQVICETLRVYSLATVVTRRTVADYQVPNTKHIIQKGTLVTIPIDAIHHDPDFYPNPERFDPERFSPQEIQKRPPITWLPFGHGQRNCIGQRFGEMQVRIGLAMLLMNYKFSLSKEMKTPLELGTANAILCSKGGIFLKVDTI